MSSPSSSPNSNLIAFDSTAAPATKTAALDLEVVESTALAVDGAEWDPARRHLSLMNASFGCMSAATILLGLELTRLRAKYPETRGRPKKNESSRVIPWADAVQAQTGLSHDSARVYMKAAERGVKKYPAIGDACLRLLAQPVAELEPADYAQAVETIVSGLPEQSQNQLLIDLGIVKAPAGRGGARVKGEGDEGTDSLMAAPDWCNPNERELYERLQTDDQRLAFRDWRPRLKLIHNDVADPARSTLPHLDEATKSDLIATAEDLLRILNPASLRRGGV